MRFSGHRSSGRQARLEGPRDRSLLRARAGWILGVTLVTVLVALAFARATSDPLYHSQVQVVVNPAVTSSGAPVTTNIDTEREVLTSGVVTSVAARNTGTSPEQLQQGMSISVPAQTTVMVVDYADRTAAAAQRRAQAIADAYIAYRAGQVALLSPATVPQAVTGPSYGVDGLAALVLGLLLGLGSALLRDRRDDTVRGPEDLTRQTALPVLAALPEAWGRTGDLAVLDHPDSAPAEVYRQLRTKLTRIAGDRDGRSTVTLVTGAADDDGAGQVAADTAVALAVAGSRVLLVQADRRSGGGPGSGGGAVEVGLDQVLRGGVPLLEAAAPARVERLLLLRPGTGDTASPEEVLDGASLDRVLRSVPADVGHVVVHAPPVLHAVETTVLAERADLVVLVACLGGTGRRDLRTAVAELREAGARLAGTVLVTGRPPSGPPQLVTTPHLNGRVPLPREAGAHRAQGRPHADAEPRADEGSALSEPPDSNPPTVKEDT